MIDICEYKRKIRSGSDNDGHEMVILNEIQWSDRTEKGFMPITMVMQSICCATACSGKSLPFAHASYITHFLIFVFVVVAICRCIRCLLRSVPLDIFYSRVQNYLSSDFINHHTFDFGLILLRVAHEKCGSFSVKGIIWVWISQKLW